MNHPHICTLYDVGDQDGTAYLVMEFVDGETLAERLRSGPLPLKDVLLYGGQIADALDDAHQQGIVHRDLKPGNVMVTRAGVKLLDFGVAKLREPQSGGNDSAETRTSFETTGGIVAGTLPYMAPEQLEGRPVDGRADLFALGVVLYEMATGRRPFQAPGQASLISDILKGEPAPLPPRDEATSSFERALMRCLAKDPDQRWQTARDLSAELKWIGGEALRSSNRLAHRRGHRGLLGVVALAGGLIAVVVWGLWGGMGPLEPRNSRLLSSAGAINRSATFSPDGSIIAFVSDAVGGVPQIWIENLAGGGPVQITTGNVPAFRPRWSSKNDQIIFARQEQGIWTIPPLGGSPRQIIVNGTNPYLSRDGTRIVFERDRGIWVADADGTGARRVEGVPEPFYSLSLSPALSPDGRTIAFFFPELGPNGDLWTIPATGGSARRLTNDVREGGTPEWTNDGAYIIFSSARAGSRTLWRVSLSGGEPAAVTTGAGEDLEPAISPNERQLIFTTVRPTWSLRILAVATGEERELLARRQQIVFPRISPDGRRIAFFGRDTVGGVQVFSVAIDGSDVRQVTSGREQINTAPRWSGDSGHIYYYRNRPTGAFLRVPAGGGVSTEIAPWIWEVQFAAEVNPQETAVVYVLNEPGHPDRTILRDLRSGEERVLPIAMHSVRWSGDGRSLAGDVKGVIRVCGVAPPMRCEILTEGMQPVFSHEQSSIFFLRRTSATTVDLWVVDSATKKELLIRKLGPFRPFDIFFDVGPDNQVIWAQHDEGRQELWLADVR